MQISSADTTRPASSTDAVGNSQLGKDEFVKLMMAQLAHQDPTSPQSNEAFIAQLAQFASVEQMQTTNQNLEALLVAQAASNQIGVAQLVGQDVVFRTSSIELDEGKATEIEAKLPAEAGNVVVTIKDEAGKVVRTVNLGPQPAGSVSFTWDGMDSSGNPMPDGKYNIDVSATSPTGEVIDGIVVGARGHVDSVSFAEGSPQLILGALKIPLGDVVEISEPRSNP